MTRGADQDLSGVSIKQLFAKARGIKARRARLMAEAGQVIAELHKRGLSWRVIGQEIGVPWATARNWALRYLSDADSFDESESSEDSTD